jgi:AcrR family transcriptional regulator
VLPEEREALAAAWEVANAELAERVKPAFGPPGSWRERMRRGLSAVLDFFAEDPVRARLYVAEVVFAGEGPRRDHRNAIDELGAMIDAGRTEPGARELTRTLADGVAGGIWHCLRDYVVDDRAGELPGMLPDLMYMIVLPYLGTEAAVQELRRPPSSHRP